MKIARYYFNQARGKYVVDCIYNVVRETKTQLVAVSGNNSYECRFKKPSSEEPGTQVWPLHRERFSMFTYRIYDNELPF